LLSLLLSPEASNDQMKSSKKDIAPNRPRQQFKTSTIVEKKEWACRNGKQLPLLIQELRARRTY
jgi:hypothetical protein